MLKGRCTEHLPVCLRRLFLSADLTVEQFYTMCDQLNFNDKERQSLLKMLGVDARATTLLFQF